jgi:hypothetical protein
MVALALKQEGGDQLKLTELSLEKCTSISSLDLEIIGTKCTLLTSKVPNSALTSLMVTHRIIFARLYFSN